MSKQQEGQIDPLELLQVLTARRDALERLIQALWSAIQVGAMEPVQLSPSITIPERADEDGTPTR